ncbi:hypothetical protein ABES96_16005 [Bacillus nitratireducens]|uniref:hypothetical protein n=1 Tax=Bacillus nitratireducens TaxID=2026193 RepID=UPI001145B7C2
MGEKKEVLDATYYQLSQAAYRSDKRLNKEVFALSLFIAFVVLFVLYFMNREAVIRVDYVLGYVFLVFFVGLTFGPRIAKKRDQ